MSDNSIETQIDITGLVDTQRAIYALNERLGDKVTVMALRLGANFLLKKVRAEVPVKSGRLKRSIGVKSSRINRRRTNGKVGVYLTVRPGRSRLDSKGAVYGRFVETGYKRGQTEIAGRKFVSSTFAANKQETLNIIIDAIEQGGQRLLQEINRT